MISTPTPFDESTVEKKFWQPEAWDVNLPSPGFISDFVLALRGIESPTKFQVWTALFMLSTIVKRDAWLAWYPKNFYSNLYVFIVAPPAICRKTTAIEWADSAFLVDYHELIEDEELRVKKRLNISRTRATSESLFQLLAPVTVSVIVDGKTAKPVEIGSNGCFIVGELATFLGRQQYNVGLIDTLTNLFDCKKLEDSFTLARKKEYLRDVYITLIGGTTPDGLAASIPEHAFGDGFLSRVIIVSAEASTRSYPMPERVVGGPSADQLKERLAWIAENVRGEYKLSSEAYDYYCVWYKKFGEVLRDNSSMQNKSLSRYSIHLLKVAFLIRVQRYELGNEVTLKDLQEAERILKATFSESKNVTEQVRNDPIQKSTIVIREYIKKKSPVKRKKLLGAHSDRYKVTDVNAALRELKELGMIQIRNEGKVVSFVSTNGDEIYEWIGEMGE